MRAVKWFWRWMLKTVMGLCNGCGSVVSSYALLMACVHTEKSFVKVIVMYGVYCVIPGCAGGYLVVIAHWKAWMESVSQCSSQVQGMRSPFVILVPLVFVTVHCSRRFCMRVLMCVSVLLSA